MTSKNAVFDGYDFAANGLTIHKLDIYSRTPKTVQLEGRAIEDGMVQVFTRYGAKPIGIEGTIIAASSDALEAAIDGFLLATSGNLRTLDIPHAGSTRRFTATAQNPMIMRSTSGASLVDFSIDFIAPDGYGSDITSQTLANQTITAAAINIPITVGGSYKAQPDITLTLTAVTGGNPTKAIRITNPATTQGITITRNWTAGDTVVLNSRTRTITVNNSQIYGVGAFPEWQPGAGYLTYSDDFTTRSLGLLATYTRRWL